MLTRGALVYISQRVVLIAFTVLIVSSLVFFGVHSLPGNAFISERLRGEALAAQLAAYGLDRPVYIQYLDFLQHAVFHGDLGSSFVNRGVQVTPLVLRELSVSAELGGSALIITVGMGMLFGVLAAIRQNSWVDYLLTTISVVGYSVPSFVIASLGILIFGLWLNDLTGGAIKYPLRWEGTYGSLASLSVPAVALGLFTSSLVARLTRASMLEVLQQDYIRTARAKGLSEQLVIIRHGLRNALIPVVTIMGPLIVSLITGSVVIENVFGIPGLGKEFVSSILRHDYNITVGVFTIFAAMIGVANLGVDVAYTFLDPRIRY